MSGVGSTNAMKKGSANNPFLAYSEADMQGFLNSAYTGCIVKYAGPSTKTAVPRGNNLNLGDAQNLVVDLTKSFTYNQGSSKSRSWYITIESETGNKCIMDITINKQTGVIGTPTLISDTIKALIYSIYTPYSSLTGSNINDLDVKFLSVTGTDVDRDVVTNWPITYGKNGWQSDCFNDSGKITLWGYGEKVTAIQNQNDMDYWSEYPILYTEPYVANVLYKVVYSNGQYYFEEFYHISDDVTTATVEDVAPGKTFYDFTGTKQTGMGTKINPYIASTADEMAAYLTSSYKGAFVKYVGDTVAVGGTSVPVNPIAVGDILQSTAAGDEGHPILYLNTNVTPDFSQFPDEQLQNEGGYSLLDVLEGSNPYPFVTAHKMSQGSDTLYALGVGNSVVYAFSETMSPSVMQLEHWGWQVTSPFTVERWGGEAKVSSVNQQDVWGAYISKDGQWTSGGGESYVKNAIYQVAEDGDTTRYMILPTLSNPGTAADLAQGKQLINGEGKVVEGEAVFSFGDYSVKVIDYDGTVLMEKKGNTGDIIDLPVAPVHDKLVFQVWSASVNVSDNKVTIADNDIMVGAVYTTSSGQNEFDITLTKVTGLSVTLNMDGTKYWGDGTSDTATSHTYNAYGDYTIKCNGTTMTTSSSSGLFGQSGSVYNYYCKKARLVTNISDYAFYNCRSLINIVISNDVTNLGKNALNSCYSLMNIIISNSVTSIGERTFSQCSSLTKIVIPNSVTSITQYMFNSCSSLTNIVIPNSVIYINTYAFYSCSSLTNIIIPNSVIRISDYAFQFCYSLKKIIIPSSITGLYSDAFADCYSLTSIVIGSSVTNLYSELFYKCYSLTSIAIPSSVTRIRNYTFAYCSSILKYDFSSHTSIPTLQDSNAFYGINALCKIIVPDSLYAEWIAASNWSTYKDYIYKASEEVTQ